MRVILCVHKTQNRNGINQIGCKCSNTGVFMFDFIKAYWKAVRKKEYQELERICIIRLKNKMVSSKYIQYLIWAQKCQNKNTEAVQSFLDFSVKKPIKEKIELYILKILFDYDLFKNKLNNYVLDSISDTFIETVKSEKGKIRCSQLRIAAAQDIGDIDKLKKDLIRLRNYNFIDETLLMLEKKYMMN